MLELDLVTTRPLPLPRAEELASLLAPVKERVFLNGCDWNVRRMLEVDPTLDAAYDLLPHLDWVPAGEPEPEPDGWGLPRGVYGYLDAHPRARHQPTAEYLADRLHVLAHLVPGAHELHVRLALFERMRADGVAVGDHIHQQGLRLDVWTLNAGMLRWQARLADALAAGADVITSDTLVVRRHHDRLPGAAGGAADTRLSAACPPHPVFWLESIAICAFGAAWIVKGQAILWDEDARLNVAQQ